MFAGFYIHLWHLFYKTVPSGCCSVNISSVFQNKFIRTPCWTLGLKFTQNKKLTVFNKVQLICNFFPGVLNNISSIIRQKAESQNGCFKKTKHVKFCEKTNISKPWTFLKHVRVRISGLEMFVFSENLTCFIFLKHPFWDSPFCLITDDFCPYIFFFRFVIETRKCSNCLCKFFISL